MFYFDLRTPNVTPSHLACCLAAEIANLPPIPIIIGQPPNEQQFEITSTEFYDADGLDAPHLDVLARVASVGPEFMVGEARMRAIIGVGNSWPTPVIHVTLCEAGPGWTLLEGECENAFRWYVQLLIARPKGVYPGVQEISPRGCEREWCLTWAGVEQPAAQPKGQDDLRGPTERSGASRMEDRSDAMFSVLVLASDPTDALRLRLDEELREIREKLQLAELREQFQLHSRTSVRPADIAQALLDVKPRIVHFSGHGTATGALCSEN